MKINRVDEGVLERQYLWDEIFTEVVSVRLIKKVKYEQGLELKE